jgi:FkbM family methyltransferase
MIAALRRNLDTNRAAEVTVLYGAAVAKPVARGIVPFHARPAFWASSVQSGQGGPTTVAVPALPFAELVAASRPSVVAMDVEGAEVELLAQALPDGVRAVVVEMHPRATGPAAVASAEAILAAQGFRSLARLARGGVRAWTRAG